MDRMFDTMESNQPPRPSVCTQKNVVLSPQELITFTIFVAVLGGSRHSEGPKMGGGFTVSTQKKMGVRGTVVLNNPTVL